MHAGAEGMFFPPRLVQWISMHLDYQFFTGAAEAALDGADRAIADVGRFLVTHPEAGDEDNDLPMLGGQ